MDDFFNDAAYQGNPIMALKTFLAQESSFEAAGLYDKQRFVGYVLELGFDSAKIITSDPFKRAVGGIPRGSFLMMVPGNLDSVPPHFTLLRVEDVAPTPLADQVMQTYFELHKKSMPELDIWTQSELQWGALNARVLGMFYPSPDDSSLLAFSGDVNAVVSAHRYRVYAPDSALLALIVNGTVTREKQVTIGSLRMTECQLPFSGTAPWETPVRISVNDFRGYRTAMFGKTRLGKSNVVKLIAQAVLDSTKDDGTVGQLVFDINGEYANDNPQDGNTSLRSLNSTRCEAYSIVKRPDTQSKPLKLNFYENPDTGLPILAMLLNEAGREAQYVKSFSAVQMPATDSIGSLPVNQRVRAVRKIQIYWAILHKAGFQADEQRLRGLGVVTPNDTRHFNPGFTPALREAAYKDAKIALPSAPSTLGALQRELDTIADFEHAHSKDDTLQSGDHPLFDADDLALLRFLKPASGGGPTMLREFVQYHDKAAGDIVKEVLGELDAGLTVILDLGNANETIRRYFSRLLSNEIFQHQQRKFTSNTLGGHYVQLYFEEAHELFPRDSRDSTDIYSKLAKEGAKFHIGVVYSTQSPSMISQELLVQSENFFVGHLASIEEARTVSKLQVAYDGVEKDILRSRTPGYMRMVTFSHRFVIPIQAFKYGADHGIGEAS